MQFKMKKVIVLVMLTLACMASAWAQDDVQARVDKIFAAWDNKTTPGAALAVIQDGKIVYEKGYGMAKLEDDIAMTPQKVFDIGSTSKQFTAACIAILSLKGKLDLNDDIRKYLPEMPVYEKPLTIQHLLHHTSGLRDYNGLLELAGFHSESDCPTVSEAREVICAQKKLNYTPGNEFSYTNTGYFLLSQIAERVSGQSLNAFAQENIFKPLGMTHTLIQEDHRQIIKNRATGYEPGLGGYKLSLSNWDETGDGNVYTTVEDLYLWDQAFYNGKLGNELMALLQTCGQLDNGKSLNYAMGLFIDTYKGLKTVSHGGAWVGYRAGFMRFPEQHFSVICLTNLASQNPDALCEKVADIYLAAKLPPEPKAVAKKTAPLKLSVSELKERVGEFQIVESGSICSFNLIGGKLQADMMGLQVFLQPESKTRFVAIDAPVAVMFDFPAAKKAGEDKIKISINGAERFHLVKAAPFTAPTAAQMQEFAGVYTSQELLNVKYTFKVDKDGLAMSMRGEAQMTFKAIAAETFSVNGINLVFSRVNGKIDGFKLSMGRVKGIEFKKL